MIITNPFTGQVLNANPEGCNQWSGKECHKVFHGTNDSIEEFTVPGSGFASDPERASFYIRQGGSSGKQSKGVPSIYKALVTAKKPYMVGSTEKLREVVAKVSRDSSFRRSLLSEGYDSIAHGVPGLDHEAAIIPIQSKKQVKIIGRLTHWGAISSPTKTVPKDWADSDKNEYED